MGESRDFKDILRVRGAITHTVSERDQRTEALNRRLDEPGALRSGSR